MENIGTCSSKHQLLAAVAHECGHAEIKLAVGIYEMSETNTPGVGAVLAVHGVTSIPEAHCYLTIGNARLDFTGLAVGTVSPFDSLLEENFVEPENLVESKVRMHKQALRAWALQQRMAPEGAWQLREACIAALVSNPAIERAGQRPLRTLWPAAHVKR